MPKDYLKAAKQPSSVERAILREEYSHINDFDNAIIVAAVEQMIASSNEPAPTVASLLVGPDRPGGAFSLNEQLRQKLTEEKSQKDFIIFSLPVLRGTHSTAAIIDTKNRKIYCADSLANSKEAMDQLRACTQAGGPLTGFELIDKTPSQKQQHDDWSCGVHTVGNMVAIINAVRADQPITLPASRNTQEVLELRDASFLAHHDHNIALSKRLSLQRIDMRRKKGLRFALEKLTDTSPDRKIIIKALHEEVPDGTSPEHMSAGRPYADFVSEFIEKNPTNKFNDVLMSGPLLAVLPNTLQDGTGKEDVIAEVLQNYLTPAPVASDGDEAAVSDAAYEGMRPPQPGIHQEPKVDPIQTIQEAFKAASIKYCKWVKKADEDYTQADGATFFSKYRHGKSGIARVERVVTLLDKSQDDISSIFDYFNDSLKNDENKVMSGKSRDHNHSFVSFFLNEMKNLPIEKQKKLGLEGALAVVDYTKPEHEEKRHKAFEEIKQAANPRNRLSLG